MEKIFILFILAIITNEAVGMTFRHRRQSNDDDDNSLDNRYGWDRPRPQWQPQQNQWPQPSQQSPNQDDDQQWPRPNQGDDQQWPRPNQGDDQQWPQSNQGDDQQWPRPNQGDDQRRPRPNQGDDRQRPLPNQGGQQPNANGSAALNDCIRSCPATPEYNPVCGTNGVTYNNPGRLNCAQQCGVSVSVTRLSPCPTTTTAAPR